MDSASAVARSSDWLRHLASIVLALSLMGAIAGALAPSSVMGWLRTVVPGFAPAWDWLDASLPWLNPLHAIAYAWIALLWKLLAPRDPWWRMPAVLVAIAIACELLQRFVPVRQPRVTDVLSDFLGIAVGWCLAMTINRLRQRG